MTTEAYQHYEDLHRLVDQLTDEQVPEARTFILSLVRQRKSSENSPRTRRHLSFIGIADAEPDLAERSEEILRELARRAE